MSNIRILLFIYHIFHTISSLRLEIPRKHREHRKYIRLFNEIIMRKITFEMINDDYE